MRILYTPAFVRQFGELPEILQEEALVKIERFRRNAREPALRVHKLQGSLRGRWSFRVNYRYCIVFCYDDSNTIALLAIGDHGVYG